MKNKQEYEITVIGAGAAGLVVAIGTAKAGKKTLLIERRAYGGDCTNYGCIPSKSLIASAKAVHTVKFASDLGIQIDTSSIETKKAFERVRTIISEIRSHEEPPVLKDLGVHTLNGTAAFKDPHTLLVDGKEVKSKQIVIATGSYPYTPPIAGLEHIPYFTNETIFNLKEAPKSIIFLGTGPISCELAQAFSRLGSDVTLIGRELLPREEKESRQVVKDAFEKEGIKLVLGYHPEKISYDKKIMVESVQADALFIGAGRRPHLKELQLDHAEINWSEKGVDVDQYGRTSQKHIWAVGDAIGPPFFTHFAENQARTVLKNLLLPFNLKKSNQALPRVTYTDPEIASIGLLSHQAIEKYGKKRTVIYTIPLATVDRNITSGRTEGFVKVVTKKWSSRILGATIVSPRAGEMLMEISTAMFTNTPLRKLSNLIHPYPIESLAVRKAADLWLTQTLLGAFRKK